MIKLRSFWVALAMGCVFSMGTTSCSDDDDDKAPTEQKTDVVTPTEAGTVMKDIVENISEKGSTLLSQASSMTTDELTKLASTIIEYNKNKANTEWKETFIKQAGSEKAAEVLDETISKLVNEVHVDMSEMTPSDLVEAFSSFFKPVDQLGEGYNGGLKEGATHEKLFNDVYDSKIANLDVTNMTAAQEVFDSMTPSQQTELVNILSAWSTKSAEGKEDKEWKNGFVKGVKLNDEAKEKDLYSKLDSLVPFVEMMKLFYGE